MRTFIGKLTSFFVGLFLALLLAEISVVAYYYFQDGTVFSVQEKLEQEPNAYFHSVVGKGGCSYEQTLLPHPYLAYVQRKVPECNFYVNKIGHHGAEFPEKKRDDIFVILLLGGSVATQLERSDNSIEEQLNEKYRKDGKKFLVLNGTLGAWKQPQQLIMLSLYGGVIDAVISLDGFNEIVFSYHNEYKNRVERPWESSYTAANSSLASDRFLLASKANNMIYHITENHWLLNKSKLFYLISRTVRENIGKTVEQADFNALVEVDKLFWLPEQWRYEERRNWHIKEYKRYLFMMHGVAKQLKLKSAYFIQPVPAIGKTLSQQEQHRVGALMYKQDYLLMEKSQMSLKEEGVPIFSLMNIYSDYSESLYRDAVHMGIDSVGYHIMAARIVEVLEKEWELERKPEQ